MITQPLSAGNFNDERFPDPFMDMASLAMPTTIQDALRWCEYLLMANGPYRSALVRILSYFLTDIEIVAAGDGDGEKRLGREERQKYLEFLNDAMGIKSVLASVGLDVLSYGNSFTSVLMPFRRFLSCPQCTSEFPLKRVVNTPDFGFSWSGYKFHATCTRCHYSGEWRHIDRRAGDTDQLKVKRWSPHEIDILHDPFTDDTAYIWKIPADYRSLIQRGHLFQLERASWEVIEAIRGNQHLMFDPDVVHHMREDSLAGVKSRGWGLSRVLTNFRQAWYCQVLQRYNEAIALDYVVPFRVITPQQRNGQGGDGQTNDPVLTINMPGFQNRVQQMLKLRRRDPARWNVLPFPIEYQALGGDATELAPKDLLDQGMATLFQAIGIPVELYNGTLTLQSSAPTMRVFEANWAPLVNTLNHFLTVTVNKVSQINGWEPVKCRLQRPSYADDMSRQMAKLQLMMGGQISRTTGLSSQGLDFAEETRLKLEEERVEAEATQEMQQEMEQAAQMDQMAAPADPAAQGGDPNAAQGGTPGGAPMAVGPAGQPMQPLGPGGQPTGPYGAAQAFAAGQPLLPNTPTTPEEMNQMAMTLAQQIMSMPESQKDSALIQLKKENPTIHALVKSQMEQFRNQAATQGRDQVLQQQFGKTAADRVRELLFRT